MGKHFLLLQIWLVSAYWYKKQHTKAWFYIRWMSKQPFHAPIDSEIYKEQPEGSEAESSTNEKLVCK